jgi:hypothetical protein
MARGYVQAVRLLATYLAPGLRDSALTTLGAPRGLPC